MSRQDRIEANRYKFMAEELKQALASLTSTHESLRMDYSWVLRLLMATIEQYHEVEIPAEVLANFDVEGKRIKAREVVEGENRFVLLELGTRTQDSDSEEKNVIITDED